LSLCISNNLSSDADDLVLGYNLNKNLDSDSLEGGDLYSVHLLIS
jgi:hypothetical protein